MSSYKTGSTELLADSDEGLIEAVVRLAREPELLRAMRTYNTDNPAEADLARGLEHR